MRWAALVLAIGAALAAAPARADGRRRSAARRAALPHRRLHQLPHRQGRAAARRRRCHREPVRRLLRPQHHARPRDRHRGLDRSSSSSGRCAKGRDPEGRPLYPSFPYTSYTRMTRRGPGGAQGLPRHAAGREPAVPAARAVVPVQPALGPVAVAVAVLHARALPARPGPGRRLESRRLPGAGARALRRVPHAAHLLRRAGVGPRLRRRAARQGEGAQHHPRPQARHRRVERAATSARSSSSA